MDHSEDVERLFSWIRAPMVRYREFAPQVEVAEAVATWPLVHKAAVETGLASAEEATPHGDYLAHQRVARAQMGLPEIAAKAIQDAPVPGTVAIPAANEPHVMPSSDRLVAALGQRVQAARADRAQGLPEPEPEPLMQPTPRPAPPPPAPPGASAAPAEPAPVAPPMSGFDEPAPESGPRRGMPLREERPREMPSRTQSAAYPSDRGALFRGEYGARDRDDRPSAPAGNPPPSSRPTDRQDSSLGAVFGRLSGPRERDRERLPDPRNRTRTSPGLGGVFDRLR